MPVPAAQQQQCLKELCLWCRGLGCWSGPEQRSGSEGEHGAAGAALARGADAELARGAEAELADLRRLLRGDVGVLLLGDVVEKGV